MVYWGKTKVQRVGSQITVTFNTGSIHQIVHKTRIPGLSRQTLAPRWPVPKGGRRLDIVQVSLWWPVAIFAASVVLCRWRAGPRVLPGGCPGCGYSLEGISGPCPECGGIKRFTTENTE